MANKFDGYLGNTLTGNKGDMGSYQHAARLYVDDNFRLAPKVKFLYYVVFNINPKVAADLQSKTGLELNYLVRSTDLPKYQIDTELFHQYNRKAHVYKKITYMPINMVMHDDNEGNVNSLWAKYYGYYFADRNNNAGIYESVNPAAYQSHTYHNKSRWPFRYGLDNGSKSSEPFFHSIQLFTINRHQFNSYLLCNPKITQWDHDAVNQDDGAGTINHRLSIVYDSVLYSNGYIEEDDPSGWAVLHYDKIPSPLANETVLKKGIEGVYNQSRKSNLLNSMDTMISDPRRRYSYDLDRGERLPYGYGSNSFYGRPYTRQAGGLSGLAFGLAAGAVSGLINAGIGMFNNENGNSDGAQDSGRSTDSQSKIDNNGVATPENPGGDNSNVSTAQDAYSPPVRMSGAEDAASIQNESGTNAVNTGTGFRSEAASGDSSYGATANNGSGQYGSPGFRSERASDISAHQALADQVSSSGNVDQVTQTSSGGTMTFYQKDGVITGYINRDAAGNITSVSDGKGHSTDTDSLAVTKWDLERQNSPDADAAAAADDGSSSDIGNLGSGEDYGASSDIGNLGSPDGAAPPDSSEPPPDYDTSQSSVGGGNEYPPE
jgi:hypothetical protein